MALKENMEAFAVKQALFYLDRDPEKNLPKLLDWLDRLDRKGTLKSERKAVREALGSKDSNQESRDADFLFRTPEELLELLL